MTPSRISFRRIGVTSNPFTLSLGIGDYVVSFPKAPRKTAEEAAGRMEWLVAALTVVFGIVSIALWMNYCSAGETDRQNSKGDINAKRSTRAADPDIADERVAAQLRRESQNSLPTRFED